MLRVHLCGGVAVERDGERLSDALLAGRQGRLVFAYLVCEQGRAVPREALAELVWGDDLPASWPASLSSIISKLRRLLVEAGLDATAALPSAFGTCKLHLPGDAWVDWHAAFAAIDAAERALSGDDTETALAAAAEAAEIAARGFLTDDCPWVDEQRARLDDLAVRAAHVRADAHLTTGSAPRAVEAAREAVAADPVRESGYRLLMRALAAAGERGEALRVWEHCRTNLVEELGVDPSPETESVYLEILGADQRTDPGPTSGQTAPPATPLPSGVVTFLLTDIVDSSSLWERHPDAMAVALERHDGLVAEVAAAHGGTLLKAKLEGDATVSVFPRVTFGVSAVLALRDALAAEPWPEGVTPIVRMALHTGEAFERGGDYFGPAVNRAARLRGLARGGQILVSQAVAELVRDHLPAGTGLVGLGHYDLRGLSRGENVFELVASTDAPARAAAALARFDRPPVPPVLAAAGPFVGRAGELERLGAVWERTQAATPRAVLLAGEPGVGKTRLAGEWARQVHAAGGVVLFGRCDEDLGAPYQPFTEAIRAVAPALGADRLRAIRGVEQVLRVVPELGDIAPELKPPPTADPDAERQILFDAVVRLLAAVAAEAPALLVLDDLHWANKPTLLLLRHILRFAEGTPIQIVGTYRNTDLDRSHPLAATLADLHRDGTTERLTVGGLPDDDVNAYLAAMGYDDDELGRALATVTSGNPFFLIEALRHVEESGGRWDESTLPQGIREAVGRRLTRLSDAANDALLAGAVAGSTFSLELVEHVLERDLVDAAEEACHAGIIIEEQGGRFRFNHALVRQSLLAEVASVRRVRLHQRIAETLEAKGSDDDSARIADLAHHYFESAWAGNAAKAVEYCRRAGDEAVSRLAYEEAADLYDRALQAVEVEGAPETDTARAELLLARCESLLAAGDAARAAVAVAQLGDAARGTERLRPWAASFAGQLAVLTEPERLDETERAVARAAEEFAALDDVAGEAKAHTVRAACLARLGRVADCETALDRGLTAARKAEDPKAVNAVLAHAPVAALWGPSPVPRAGGRCLDVIRLLRITTGSPAVEAVSIRSQALLEAFRGRIEPARRMLEKARQSLRELGLRQGLLEVELFAGMVELIAEDPAAAEPHLRKAHDGFLRMGIEADVALAGALLARAMLALGRDEEADHLCQKSERLGGSDLKTSITWRAVRAELLAGRGGHDEARRLAEDAVQLAAGTDALVDHGDACLALATVLAASGDTVRSAAAAAQAAALYDRKGATALAERARRVSQAPAPIGVADPDPALASMPAVENAATRVGYRFVELVLAHDWAAVEELMAADFALLPRRRRRARDQPADRARTLETLKLSDDNELGADDIRPAALATRGDRLALFQVRVGQSTADVFDERLALVGTDDDERLDRLVFYDPENIDDAYAKLDAGYLAGEAAPHADVYGAVLGTLDAENRRDAATARVSRDAVVIDHRPTSFGTTGRDPAAWRRIVTDTFARTPDSVRRIRCVHRLDSRGAVITAVRSGTTTDGAAVEFTSTTVFVVESGEITRMEVFAETDVAAALARFDETTGTPHVAVELPVAPNACFHLLSQMVDAFHRSDWDAVRRLHAPAYRAENRSRLPLLLPSGNVEDRVERMRAGRELGFRVLRTELRATRGERLALVREARGGSLGEVETVSLFELGVDNTLAFDVVFDPEDVDAAFAELDARYLRGEASEWSDVYRTLVANFEAVNHRDTSLAALATDMVVVDHRAAATGAGDAVRLLDELAQRVELLPDFKVRVVEVLAVNEQGALVRTRQQGSADETGPLEFGGYNLQLVDGGLTTRMELFADTEAAAALTRFNELTRASPSAIDLSTTATLATIELDRCFAARDWDGFRSLLDDGFRSESLLRFPLRERMVDADAHVAVMRSVADAGVQAIVRTVVATRGDRVCLTLRVTTRDTSSEGEQTGDKLVVSTVTAEGRLARSVSFDTEAVDAAYAELDAQYLAGEGAAHAEVFQAFARGIDAINRRDARTDVLTDDFVTVDGRLAGHGTLDRDDYLATVDDMVRQMRDVTTRIRAVPALAAHGLVYALGTTGTNAEGGLVETSGIGVAVIRDGRIARAERFAESDLAAALARLDELGARPASLENVATRTGERLAAAFLAADVAAMGDVLAEGFVHESRLRFPLRERVADRATYLAGLASIRSDGVEWTDGSVIAIRGNRLYLSYRIVGNATARASGPQGAYLSVSEVDSSGRFVHMTMLEAEAVDAAFAELEERYLAGEAAPFAEVYRTFLRAGAVMNHPQAAGDVLSPDFVHVDRTPAGSGTATLDQFQNSIRERARLIGPVRSRLRAVHRLDHHGVVFTLVVASAADDSDSAVEW